MRAVEVLTLCLEQRLVCGVLNEGMLERIDRVWEGALPEKQLGSEQLAKRAAQLVLRLIGDRSKKFVRELPADHGADLGDLLGRGQPVEARH